MGISIYNMILGKNPLSQNVRVRKRIRYSRMSDYPRANYSETLSYDPVFQGLSVSIRNGFLFSNFISLLIIVIIIIVAIPNIYCLSVHVSLGYSSPVGEVGMSGDRKRAVASLVPN